MRIGILSDLHFEFRPLDWRSVVDAYPNDCDVLVLPGDITSMYFGAPELGTVLQAFCSRFAHVVFVAGNHEYYSGSPTQVDAIRAPISCLLPNLHWLDDSAITIDGVRFLGGTLWFRCPQSDVGKWALNDYRAIKEFEPWVYEKSGMTRLYLHENLRKGDVMVTHHLPTPRSVHAKYVGSPMTPFFVCDIEYMIREREPALVIHGHTHQSVDYAIGETRVVCNPYGYHGHDMNAAFDSAKIIEVQP